MKIKDISSFLEQIAPVSLQESYDNCGLLTGDENDAVKGILVCLDMTPDVVDEAVQKGCNLVVGHHPIIFQGLKQINGKNYVERSVIKAIKSDIALYAIHTNLDNIMHNGVNEMIAKKLGLTNLEILRKKEPQVSYPNATGLQIGSGVIGQLPKPMESKLFLQYVKSKMEATCIRYSGNTKKKINKVAVCGGSGSQFLKDAIGQGADAYVSADFKYHEFFDAEEHLLIADVGHFESEQFTIDLLCALIINNFSNFAVHKTEINTNPVKYYI